MINRAPPLTTRQPLADMATAAFELLRTGIEDSCPQPGRSLLSKNIKAFKAISAQLAAAPVCRR